MAELDVLTVRLDADIARFQAQLDRARADLSKFAVGANVSAASTEKVGAAAGRSIPGLSRLGNALENVTTRAIGVPGVFGKVVDVFGALAIGSAPMVGVFAGLAGAALLFNKLTEGAREAREQLEKVNDELKKLREQQANPAGIPILAAARGNLDVLRRQLEESQRGRTVGMRGGEVRTIIDFGRVSELKRQIAERESLIRAGENRITEIVTEGQKKRANEIRKSADDAIAEHRRMYAEMEAIARANEAHRQLFFPDINIALPFSQPQNFAQSNRTGGTRREDTAAEAAERMGFFIPTIDATDNALAQLKNTVEKLNKELGLVPTGSTAPEGTAIGRIGGRLRDMLNPEMILSGLATGFLSQGINLAISGIGKVIGGFFGLGDAADEASRQMQLAVNNIRAQVARMRGDTEAANFFELKSTVLGQLEQIGLVIPAAEAAKSLAELLAALKAVPPLPFFDDENLQAVIDWLTESMKGLGDQVNRLADSLRNIPQGYKIALAQFNATTPSPALAGAVGANLTVTVRAEPEGIFRTVERRAVQVKRTGGVLAWELDV